MSNEKSVPWDVTLTYKILIQHLWVLEKTSLKVATVEARHSLIQALTYEFFTNPK